MKIFKGSVYLNDLKSVASHFINVETDTSGRMQFYFTRIIHNLDDHEEFPIPEMHPATFKEQLRSLNKAFAITRINVDQISQFIEIMLREAYPEAEDIKIEELD